MKQLLRISLKIVPLSSTQSPSVQHIGSRQDHTFSAPKISQFNIKNPSVSYLNSSVPHLKPLSFTPKPPQFNTPLSYFLSEEFLVWNWGIFGVELRGGGVSEGFLVWNWGVFDVEVRGFWCWTGVFLVWNWGVFGVELRGFWCGTEGFWGLKRSGPFGCKWCVELRGCGTEGNPLKQFY